MRLHAVLFFSALLIPLLLASGQSSPTQPASTIQANSNLVVVDAVVTDSKHNPVHKLTSADFTVLENGMPQAIKTFEEHVSTQAIAPFPPMPKFLPGTFTNFTNAPASGALNILLLDSLNTPMTAQADVRNQMPKYLKEPNSGRRMAIFGLTTRLILLQGFTSDPELLRAVLSGKKGGPKGSVLMTDTVNGDNPGADDLMMDTAQDAADAMGNTPDAAQMLANLQQWKAETHSFQLQLRARMTLDAFNLLARYLSALPGRKNLIWFSGSFPITILPDGDLQNPFSIVASSADEFRETTEMLSRGQVAVYPIDARGLMVTPMQSVNNSGRNYAGNPRAFAKDNSTFLQNTSDEHGTMQSMAEVTGGQAFVDTNGLKEAVEKAIDAGSNYYTLTYTPTNQQWKGEFRRIQIHLAQRGLNLAYRRGYFADDPNATPRDGESAISGIGQAPAYSALKAAMVRGGPDPTEVIFVANVRPRVEASEPDVAPGNNTTEKTKGPYRRYTVQFGVNARNLDCPLNPDGTYHCAIEVLIFVYDAEGNLLNSTGGAIHSNVSRDQYSSFLQTGIRFHQDVSVPAKGESFLRIGIHDQTSNHVGAVELPISDVSKLPPLTAAAPK